MSKIIRYAAVNTKIRALEGQFLTREDYMALLEMTSVQDIVRYLKQTSYKTVFENIDETALHRGAIEVMLKRHGIDIMARLNNYFQGKYAGFLNSIFMRYELEDLKVLIRAVYTHKDYIDSPHAFIYIGRYGKLDLQKLTASKNITDIVSNLKGTPYYNYLAPLTLKDGREDQFQIEMALDLAYFNEYKRQLEVLSNGEKATAYKIQGMYADLQNLQLIYRGRKFYNLPPDLLLYYTINFNGRIGFDKLKEICYSQDISQMEDKLKSTEYGFLFEHDRTKDMFMERRAFRYRYYKLLKHKRSNTMDIVQTIVFFDLLEFEIRDIITIIENIRYNNEDPDQIKRCLIREL